MFDDSKIIIYYSIIFKRITKKYFKLSYFFRFFSIHVGKTNLQLALQLALLEQRGMQSQHYQGQALRAVAMLPILTVLALHAV